jgi:hypothetical protein
MIITKKVFEVETTENTVEDVIPLNQTICVMGKLMNGEQGLSIEPTILARNRRGMLAHLMMNIKKMGTIQLISGVILSWTMFILARRKYHQSRSARNYEHMRNLYEDKYECVI